MKSLISIKPLSNNPNYDFEFTIEMYLRDGYTCKQDGYIKCYADGEVSNIDKVGDPYDIKDRKGNAVTNLGW